MIEIRGISKSFKDHEVLKDINLKIPDKKILGLIGINGAGKSTLLRVISGIYSADDGVVLVDYPNYLLYHK
jgi:ABC-type sugar transport system ATPase subunit